MSEIFYVLLAIAVVLTIVSLLVPLAERLRLPHTVLLAVTGVTLGLTGSWFARDGVKLGPVGDLFAGLEQLEVGTDYFLPLFLPPLLFTAGLMINVRRLWDEISAVLLMAIVAVVVCIVVVAGVVHVATGVDIVVCMLLGAIVSTTDPAAVIGIFRDVGAPKRLSILAEGESLFNDAVAIATFTFCIQFLAARASPEVSGVASEGLAGLVHHFVYEFIGGIVFGVLIARAAVFILPRLGHSNAAIASVTVSLAYLSYLIADHYLQVSGVVAVVMAALTIAAYGPTHLHPRQWTALQQIWHQLEFWSNCLIFVLASMVAATVLPRVGWFHVWGMCAVAAGAMLARTLVVFGMLPVLERVRFVAPVDVRYKTILVWGGLRGAVTIVLAMVAAGDDRLPQSIREFTALLAIMFVLFTLFVNATSLGVVMRLLGLDKLTHLELALRDRVLALSRINAERHLEEVMRRHNALVDGIDVDPASAGEAKVDDTPPDLALSLEERLRVGLLTLCTQEKELYLELFEQQTLSRRMIARFTARADRLIDAVRDGGATAYVETLQKSALPDHWFRLALWAHRRLGYEHALTRELADRFETLMVSQDVLAELAVFNLQSVADLVGREAEERLGQMIDNRRRFVDDALRALSLQYPGYATAIRDRQLERAAIRFTSMEYAQRLRDSVISREVYDDLREELNERRKAVSGDLPLDLGLQLAGMIERVPLFSGLDAQAVRELGKSLRPVVALPNEKIVAKGGASDAMYFIAAGAVTVHAAGRPIVLREGAFFGEMGLLSDQPRNADVVSHGYSHLLMLSRRDFRALLGKRPDVRGEIEAMAARRVAENEGQASP
ncbi:MAG: cation:proton antiporter [Enhydrobacter sp.]|nr:MAG: cation:proton antiporter [Enhydrobacter sp.]